MIDEKKLIAEMREYLSKYEWLNAQGDHDQRWYAMTEALELVEHQPKVGEWIPCSERLPETSQDLEVTCKNGGRFVAYYTGKNWYHCITNAVVDVIAWKEPSEPWEGEE